MIFSLSRLNTICFSLVINNLQNLKSGFLSVSSSNLSHWFCTVLNTLDSHRKIRKDPFSLLKVTMVILCYWGALKFHIMSCFGGGYVCVHRIYVPLYKFVKGSLELGWVYYFTELLVFWRILSIFYDGILEPLFLSLVGRILWFRPSSEFFG